MPSYECEICGKIVNISRLDAIKQRCPDCDLVIANGEYKQNISGGLTLFASTGTNLGHVVMSEALFRFYSEMNPDETIVFLDPTETMNITEYELFPKADKIFWADVSNIVNEPKDNKVIPYRFSKECTAIAEMGFYPEWNTSIPVYTEDPDDYFVVLHMRNVKGNPEKNVTSDEARSIMSLLFGNDFTTYIIGNDDSFDIPLEKEFIDYRKKLSLNQIAYLCGHENCITTIGKDCF